MKITVLILSGAQGAVLVLEISDFRHMPWVLTCFIILIDYTANKINLCFINLCFISSHWAHDCRLYEFLANNYYFDFDIFSSTLLAQDNHLVSVPECRVTQTLQQHPNPDVQRHPQPLLTVYSQDEVRDSP